jgi:hypothetical protein
VEGTALASWGKGHLPDGLQGSGNGGLERKFADGESDRQGYGHGNCNSQLKISDDTIGNFKAVDYYGVRIHNYRSPMQCSVVSYQVPSFWRSGTSRSPYGRHLKDIHWPMGISGSGSSRRQIVSLPNQGNRVTRLAKVARSSCGQTFLAFWPRRAGSRRTSILSAS